MGAEARIKELGIVLPEPARPMGNYVPGVRVGNLLFLSVEETRGRLDCGVQGVTGASSPERFRGVRIGISG